MKGYNRQKKMCQIYKKNPCKHLFFSRKDNRSSFCDTTGLVSSNSSLLLMFVNTGFFEIIHVNNIF